MRVGGEAKPILPPSLPPSLPPYLLRTTNESAPHIHKIDSTRRAALWTAEAEGGREEGGREGGKEGGREGRKEGGFMRERWLEEGREEGREEGEGGKEGNVRLDQCVKVLVEDVILFPGTTRVLRVLRADDGGDVEGGRETTAGGGVGDLWGGREG